MNNQEYVKCLLARYDLITIDTSALMNDENLQRFVENHEETLLEYGKKILVNRSVWAELLHMYNCGDEEKQEKATKAICIINMHRNIFLIDGRGIRTEEIWTALADKDILSDLTKNITQHNQLLITNDDDLANDVLNLNNLKSCRGHRVAVCRLQYSGDLVLLMSNKTITALSPEPQVRVRKVEKSLYVSRPNETNVSEETWFECNKKYIFGCGAMVLVAVGGFVVRRNWKAIISCFHGVRKAAEKVVTGNLVDKVAQGGKAMIPDRMNQIKQAVVPICQTIIPSNFKLTGNLYTARELGAKMLCSAREINRRIISRGLAERLPSGELVFTELGKGLGEMKWKTTRYDYSFTNIEWDEAILPLLFSAEELDRRHKGGSV